MKIFSEKQRFNQWWLILLEVIVFVMMTVSFYKEFESLGSDYKNESLILLILGYCFMLLIILFIHSIKLNSRIDETGVSYQFYPIQFKFRKVSWEELATCKVRKYSPIAEYGGWGMRGVGFLEKLGWTKGRAYNIKGDMGIQLIFKDGSGLLIGTQKPVEAERTIAQYSYKIEK